MAYRCSVMPVWLFRLIHLFCPIFKPRAVDWGNSADGKQWMCSLHMVVNETKEQKDGSRMSIGNFDDWCAFHENHGGEIYNLGGGTHEFGCDKCGCTY